MEILLVVGIIAILAGIVIVAINTSKQLATVRNTERKSDIKQIDSAILQYYIDNFHYPAGITSDLKGICNTGTLSTTTDSGIDCGILVDLTSLVPTYITSIPTDPQSTTTNTGYYVKEDSTTHKIGTKAWLAELDQDININAASSTVAEGEEEETCDATCLGMRDNFVAHYTFNDDVNDSVGNNDGTWSGTPTYVSSQPGMGKAGSFNGGSDYIDCGVISDLDSAPFSSSLWVKPTTVDSNWQGLVAKRQDGVNGWVFAISPSGYLAVFDGGGWQYSNTQLTAGAWQQVGFTYGSGSVTFYLNGSPDGIISATLPSYIGSTFKIGEFDTTYYFDGEIEDVRIYDRALEQSEITALAAGTEGE